MPAWDHEEVTLNRIDVGDTAEVSERRILPPSKNALLLTGEIANQLVE